MNAMAKLNDDAFTACYCKYFLDSLQIKVHDEAIKNLEEIIACIASIDEFKSSISKLMNSSAASSQRNNAFYDRV